MGDDQRPDQNSRLRRFLTAYEQCSESELKALWRQRFDDDEDRNCAAIAAVSVVKRRLGQNDLTSTAISHLARLAEGSVVAGTFVGSEDLVVVLGAVAVLSGATLQVLAVDPAGEEREAARLTRLLAPLGVEVSRGSAGMTDHAAVESDGYGSIVVLSWEHALAGVRADVPSGQCAKDEATWAFVSDADAILLDRAEWAIQSFRPVTYSRTERQLPVGPGVSVRDYVRGMDLVAGFAPALVADYEANEIRMVYGSDVIEVPQVQSSISEPRDLMYFDNESRLKGLLRLVRGVRGVESSLIIVADEGDIDQVFGALDADGIPYRTAFNYSSDSGASWSVAAEPQAVTVATRTSLVGQVPSGTVRAERRVVVAIGRSMSRRTDDRVRRLAENKGGAGSVVFFTTRSDEIMAPLNTPSGRWMDRIIFRGSRRERGVRARPGQMQLVAQLQEAAGRKESDRRAQVRRAYP